MIADDGSMYSRSSASGGGRQPRQRPAASSTSVPPIIPTSVSRFFELFGPLLSQDNITEEDKTLIAAAALKRSSSETGSKSVVEEIQGVLEQWYDIGREKDMGDIKVRWEFWEFLVLSLGSCQLIHFQGLSAPAVQVMNVTFNLLRSWGYLCSSLDRFLAAPTCTPPSSSYRVLVECDGMLLKTVDNDWLTELRGPFCHVRLDLNARQIRATTPTENYISHQLDPNDYDVSDLTVDQTFAVLAAFALREDTEYLVVKRAPPCRRPTVDLSSSQLEEIQRRFDVREGEVTNPSALGGEKIVVAPLGGCACPDGIISTPVARGVAVHSIRDPIHCLPPGVAAPLREIVRVVLPDIFNTTHYPLPIVYPVGYKPPTTVHRA